jgi:hypothetical protein
MINYLLDKFFYSINYDLENDINHIKSNNKKVLLLGDGFFARGFLHNIDYTKFTVVQFYQNKFINPQDIMYSLQRNKIYHHALHIRDFITKPTISVKLTINNLDISTPNKVNINNNNYNYDYLVIGLGSNKPLHEWKNDINRLNYINDKNLSVIGMGPTGFELSCILSKKHNIYLFDILPKDVVFKNKEHLLQILEDNKINLIFGNKYNNNYSKDFIFCGGTKPNNLTKLRQLLFICFEQNVYNVSLTRFSLCHRRIRMETERLVFRFLILFESVIIISIPHHPSPQLPRLLPYHRASSSPHTVYF